MERGDTESLPARTARAIRRNWAGRSRGFTPRLATFGAGYTEWLQNDTRIDVLGEQQCRTRVPQIMEPHVGLLVNPKP
jgi:hypothetical protein